jgi:hypothetical protein
LGSSGGGMSVLPAQIYTGGSVLKFIEKKKKSNQMARSIKSKLACWNMTLLQFTQSHYTIFAL